MYIPKVVMHSLNQENNFACMLVVKTSPWGRTDHVAFGRESKPGTDLMRSKPAINRTPNGHKAAYSFDHDQNPDAKTLQGNNNRCIISMHQPSLRPRV